jgi:hypothetical protein
VISRSASTTAKVDFMRALPFVQVKRASAFTPESR